MRPDTRLGLRITEALKSVESGGDAALVDRRKVRGGIAALLGISLAKLTALKIPGNVLAALFICLFAGAVGEKVLLDDLADGTEMSVDGDERPEFMLDENGEVKVVIGGEPDDEVDENDEGKRIDPVLDPAGPRRVGRIVGSPPVGSGPVGPRGAASSPSAAGGVSSTGGVDPVGSTSASVIVDPPTVVNPDDEDKNEEVAEEMTQTEKEYQERVLRYLWQLEHWQKQFTEMQGKVFEQEHPILMFQKLHALFTSVSDDFPPIRFPDGQPVNEEVLAKVDTSLELVKSFFQQLRGRNIPYNVIVGEMNARDAEEVYRVYHRLYELLEKIDWALSRMRELRWKDDDVLLAEAARMMGVSHAVTLWLVERHIEISINWTTGLAEVSFGRVYTFDDAVRNFRGGGGFGIPREALFSESQREEIRQSIRRYIAESQEYLQEKARKAGEGEEGEEDEDREEGDPLKEAYLLDMVNVIGRLGDWLVAQI